MGAKILVVDDDPVVHHVLKHYLERKGYELLEAHTGQQALELAGREQPMVIILDVLMPEMSGLTALRRLKENETTARIPVIVVTVNADRATHLESQVSGAAAFLRKPFRPAELLNTLEQLIEEQKGAGSSASAKVEPGKL